MPKKVGKSGPLPGGFGPPFSMRLSLAQEDALQNIWDMGKAEQIRTWITKGNGPESCHQLGDLFTMRLTLQQEAKVNALVAKTGLPKIKILRDWISKGM